jgi:SAM-dependent methyltransferase
VTLTRLQRDWEELADVDPLWAILTWSDRKNGRWDVNEFFETGEREIASVLSTAADLGLPRRFERALDFGCGVGRLTRALARRFDECYGVDISAGMVERGLELNRDFTNCRLLVNAEPNLGLFEPDSFDFVYSSLVLQHLPGMDVVCDFIREFVRVLRPGGLAVFQVPSAIPWPFRLQPQRRLYGMLRSIGVDSQVLLRRTMLTPMRMVAVPPEIVRAVLEKSGARLAYAEADGETGLRYFAALDQA